MLHIAHQSTIVNLVLESWNKANESKSPGYDKGKKGMCNNDDLQVKWNQRHLRLLWLITCIIAYIKSTPKPNCNLFIGLLGYSQKHRLWEGHHKKLMQLIICYMNNNWQSMIRSAIAYAQSSTRLISSQKDGLFLVFQEQLVQNNSLKVNKHISPPPMKISSLTRVLSSVNETTSKVRMIQFMVQWQPQQLKHAWWKH